MKIEMVALDKLKPYARNTKKHPEAQVTKLAAIIKEFGFTVPLVVAPDGEIIAGHGRLLAAQQLGMDKVPCVRRVDLSAAQIKAYRIADNKIAESEWDMDFLKEELEWLKDLDFDLELTGWGELPAFEFKPPKEDEDQEKPAAYVLRVTFEDEQEQQELFDELKGRGFKVKV